MTFYLFLLIEQDIRSSNWLNDNCFEFLLFDDDLNCVLLGLMKFLTFCLIKLFFFFRTHLCFFCSVIFDLSIYSS